VSFNKNTEQLGFLPIPYANAIAFVTPTVFGPLFNSWIPGKYPEVVDWNNLYAYVGFGAAALVVLGWAVGWDRNDRTRAMSFGFFSIAGMFLLLRYLGFPIAAAVNLLPVLGRLSPKHANGVTVFCLVVAAALVVDRLKARPDLRVRWWMIGLAGSLVAAVLALIGQRGGFRVVDKELAVPYGAVTALLVALVLLAVWVGRRWQRLDCAGAGIVVTAASLGELAAYVPLGNSSVEVLLARLGMCGLVLGAGVLLALRRWVLASGLGAVAVVGYGLIVALPSVGLPRQFDVDAPPPFMRWLKERTGDEYRSFGIAPDFSSIAAIQDISVVGPVAPWEFNSFVDLIAPPDAANFFRGSSTFSLTQGSGMKDTYDLRQYPKAKPLLDWAGVRYLVLDRSYFRQGVRTDDEAMSDPSLGVRPVYEDSRVRILESVTARPKAEFWTKASVYPSQQTIVAELKADPAAILGPPKIEASTAGELAPEVTASGDAAQVPVTVESYRANEVRLQVMAPAAGVIVLKDSHYPGWRAWVDGKATPVLRVDGMVRGVAVATAGQHQVRLEYRPESFERGAVLAGLILALLCVGLVWRRTR
jgi:hypothetical protein